MTKSLKEIEEKIEEIRKYERWDLHQGWLVGLGMAKGIYDCKTALTETPEDCICVLADNMKPKTPYEQGIKEALEFCLKEGD